MREYQSAEIKDLAADLAKAQQEITHAKKSAENPYFKSNYADLPAVMDAARPALSKHGLSVTQMTDSEEGRILLITQITHSSGQWLRSYYPVNPVKADPQGLGSAITYARRYAYSAIVGVASMGEDDDGNAASGLPDKKETAISAKKRFAALKKAIQESDDPAAIWNNNIDEINKFLDADRQFYDDLVAAGKKRKEELLQYDLIKNQLNEGQ